jgi:3-deoxy-D-manno-octulosonate 8-phosphate phosphatase KdsC-like HAD superfamily phosphatase
LHGDRHNDATDAPGGRGAVREPVKHILKTQGKWEAAVAKYMP